jgi:NADH-quinone oxidoreductase subunit L
VGIGFIKIHQTKQVPEEDAAITGFTKVLYNKYYVDEIYDFYFREINQTDCQF